MGGGNVMIVERNRIVKNDEKGKKKYEKNR